jgi:hypothetical protein
MVALNKRKGTSDSMATPLESPTAATVVVVKSGSDWSDIQAKLDAIKMGPATDDQIIDDENYQSPRSITDQLWHDKQQSMLEQASKLKAKLQQKIQEATEACALKSNALQQAQSKLFALTARRDAMQTDVVTAEQTIVDLNDEIDARREQVLALKEQALRLRHDKEEQLLQLKYMISFYAKCTGIAWDYDQENILAGIVVSRYGSWMRVKGLCIGRLYGLLHTILVPRPGHSFQRNLSTIFN